MKVAGKVARWKMDPMPTGLMSVAMGERGHNLVIDGEAYAHAGAVYKNSWNHTGKLGYSFYCPARTGIPYRNTCREPLFATVGEAKEACVQYIKECLESAQGEV